MIGVYVSEALHSLLANKQRTVLALIGIVIGVGSVIAMVSVGGMVREMALSQFKEMGTDLITIRGQPGAGGDNIDTAMALGLGDGDGWLTGSAAMINGQGTIRSGPHEAYAQVFGISDQLGPLLRMTLAHGRLPHALDGYEKFAVLGHDVADQLKVGPDIIGDDIRIGGQAVTVIGLLGPSPMASIAGLDPNQAVLMPILAVERYFSQTPDVTVIGRHIAEVEAIQASQAIQNWFSVRKPGLVTMILTADQLIAQLEEQMRMFTLLLGAIGSISLIVGGVGVMNVMLVSVSERRKEVGIRRALGARQGDIRAQFLTEAMILSMVGGVLGVGLGVGSAYAVSQFTGWPFLVSPFSAVIGLGVSTIIGIFFGFYPAHQAARMDPIDALRSG